MSLPRDTQTADLFHVPRAPVTVPGCINYSREIAATMSRALKDCAADRIEIAARMTRLMGREITLLMLNAYTAESHIDHNISLERAIAFDIATESRALLGVFAAKLGCGVALGEETLLTELGRIEQQKAALAQRERAVKAHIRGKR